MAKGKVESTIHKKLIRKTILHYIFSKYLALEENTLLKVTNTITINVMKFMF